MKLTPLDIRKQEFKKLMRGYDPVEVDTFLEMVAADLEEALKAQKESRDRIIELETQLKDYRQIEKDAPADAPPGAGSHREDVRIRQAGVRNDHPGSGIPRGKDRGTGQCRPREAERGAPPPELQEGIAHREAPRVLLSSELDLLKTLDMGGAEELGVGSSLGTGKESVEVESILKNLDDDRSPQTH